MKLQDLYLMQKEFASLIGETSSPKWDGADMITGTAKAIGKEQWLDAHRVALEVHFALPHLPRPTPGAHPDGHITLTWDDGRSHVDATLNPSLVGKRLSWIARRDGTDSAHAADKLRPLVESLRSTFPKSSLVMVA